MAMYSIDESSMPLRILQATLTRPLIPEQNLEEHIRIIYWQLWSPDGQCLYNKEANPILYYYNKHNTLVAASSEVSKEGTVDHYRLEPICVTSFFKNLKVGQSLCLRLARYLVHPFVVENYEHAYVICYYHGAYDAPANGPEVQQRSSAMEVIFQQVPTIIQTLEKPYICVEAQPFAQNLLRHIQETISGTDLAAQQSDALKTAIAKAIREIQRPFHGINEEQWFRKSLCEAVAQLL